MLKKIPYEEVPSACLLYQTNCPLNCVYCYLQTYYSSFEGTTVYVNFEDLLKQVKKSSYQKFYAGELTDSLELDGLTNYTEILIPFFNQHPELKLELRSKSNYVDQVLSLPSTPNITLTWTLNPPLIIEEYEKKTKSLDQRLEAARKCEGAGFKIGFHFDPIFYYPSWEKDYELVIKQIEKTLKSPPKIAYITLGGFRFTPSLKKIMKEKFPEIKKIFSGEFVLCPDGKYRYFKPIRKHIYQLMRRKIKEILGEVPVYLCMETPALRKWWHENF
jgi:spore photoproduct lyase